jgi:lipoprotein-releasing system permease protein
MEAFTFNTTELILLSATGVLLIIQLIYYLGLFKLDPETYYVSMVPVSMNIWLFLLINAGTLLTSVLMLVGPSYLITKINPADSMRYE